MSDYDEATWQRAARAYALYAAHLAAAGCPPRPRWADLPAVHREAFCALALALWFAGRGPEDGGPSSTQQGAAS